MALGPALAAAGSALPGLFSSTNVKTTQQSSLQAVVSSSINNVTGGGSGSSSTAPTSASQSGPVADSLPASQSPARLVDTVTAPVNWQKFIQIFAVGLGVMGIAAVAFSLFGKRSKKAGS